MQQFTIPSRSRYPGDWYLVALRTKPGTICLIDVNALTASDACNYAQSWFTPCTDHNGRTFVCPVISCRRIYG